MMKKNEDLQRDVQEAIKWEPLLHAAEIGVIAQDGIVTLTGVVDSFAKKTEAEHAAKTVKGVKAIVEKIEVDYGNLGKKKDVELAQEVIESFKWDWAIPSDKIKVTVEKGWVTLEGEVNWNYQREAAKKAVNGVSGAKGVTNSIQIKAERQDAVEKKAIENALARNSVLDAHLIKVKVAGNHVTLNGEVHSLYQKEEAGRIAWNAPGVWVLDNELVIHSSRN
jgi:osmotically-inducible protein OsmY